MNDKLLNQLEKVMQDGVKSADQANDLLAQCYNAITDLIAEDKPKKSAGKWGMTRLWRSWMSDTAKFMAGNGAIMPLWVNPDGTYTRTRQFNKNDAHDLFTIKYLGTDESGNRLSWVNSPADGEVVATQGQRFHALQQHQIWMTERGISHINPRDSEFASLCAMCDE